MPFGASGLINAPRGGSALVRVTDLALPGAPALGVQTAGLAAGDDGLTGLTDNDFIGSEVGKTGLRALDTIQDLSLLLVPGRATAAVHNAMVTYCEGPREGLVFAVLDPGRLTFADVTLERGATQDRDLFDWFQDVAITSSGLGLRDADFLVDEFDRVDCGVDTAIEVECPECFTVQEVELPFDRGFFLPGKARTARRRDRSSSSLG